MTFMPNNFLAGAFGPPCTVNIIFDDAETRKQVKRENGQTDLVPLFHGQESVVGEVRIEPAAGKKVEHSGIRIELLGQIELYFDRGNFYDFTSLVKDLDIVGEISERKVFAFDFSNVEMQYESYNGVNVRLRYILKVTITRQYATNIVKEKDFWMEVGIEDCLHIEFEYGKSKYIKHMEIEIRRKESTGSGPNTYNEFETLAKYEIMDGESIPIRLFLSPYDLTPTYRNVNNKFSVRYNLNLVLVDEEDRRYFKQQEIAIYRHE
eukprot:jgi/Mesen1/6863/ME000351S05985